MANPTSDATRDDDSPVFGSIAGASYVFLTGVSVFSVVSVVLRGSVDSPGSSNSGISTTGAGGRSGISSSGNSGISTTGAGGRRGISSSGNSGISTTGAGGRRGISSKGNSGISTTGAGGRRGISSKGNSGISTTGAVEEVECRPKATLEFQLQVLHLAIPMLVLVCFHQQHHRDHQQVIQQCLM